MKIFILQKLSNVKFQKMTENRNQAKVRRAITLSITNFFSRSSMWAQNIIYQFFASLTCIEICIVQFLLFKPWRPSWILCSQKLSTPGILGDFMGYHSGHIREHILRNSAFYIFFPGSTLMLLAYKGDVITLNLGF